MGKFERQFRDLMASFRSVWRWRGRARPDDPRAQGGRPRPDLGDLRRSDAGQKAEEMYRDLRTGDVHDTPGESVRTCVSGAAGDVDIEL